MSGRRRHRGATARSALTDRGLARFKLPERVELVKEFPVSPFGKASKLALAKQIAEKLRAEAGSTA